ncbi:MAG TPA: CHAT domain-containing protein [Xanthomarina sp.]|nr:CHAT domain-containing protein [Xanthomarina sp.]
MKKTWYGLLLFMIYHLSFSQHLEESIYTATETFIANKNLQSLETLNKQEATFKSQVSTKDEHLAFVFLLCNKAYYLKDINRYHLAVATYESAWKQYSYNQLSSISDYDIIEYCLKPLGNLYTKTNNYTDAENTIKQYLSLAKENKNNTQYVAGIINLSVLYQTRGMHQSVVDLINKTKHISNIDPKQKDKLNALKASSLIALNKSSNNNLENDIILPNTNNQYNKQQLAYELALKKGDYKLALKHFIVSEVFQKKDSLTNRDIAKHHVKKAQLHYLLSDFERANQNLQSALHTLIPNLKRKTIPEKTRLYAENTFIDIFDLLARLQTNPEIALAFYDLSFYVSGLLIENLTSQESIITNQVSNRKRSEHCIDLLFESYQHHSNIEIFTRALQYAETHKAFVLKEVSRKKSLLEKYPNDSLLLKEQQFLIKQEQLTHVLIKTQLGYQATTNDSLNKQLLDVSMALKTLQQQIDDTYPEEKQTFAVSKIQKQLARDQANIIIYFYGERAIYQFIISEQNTAFLKMPLTDTLKNTMTNFIHLFDTSSAINNNIQEFTSQAFNMYQSLHLNETSTTKNLIIIPDGLLNFIPFEALLTEKTASFNFSKMPFLVTKQQVVYNSSLTFYLETPEAPKNSRVLGIFPVFKNSNQPLTYSLDEAKAIEKEMDASMFFNSEATKNNFLKSASNHTILHISTHATSGDFINPASIAFYDEPMLLNELYSLNINPKLVVLSACETGIGKLQKGEGAMSIARGFQYAGAKNILFSLWQINDASTANMMSLFYKNYKKTASASVANRQSKLSYLKDPSISNIKKSPYYWSAFVYYGNPIDFKKETPYMLYYFFAALAVFIVVFLYFRKQK